jgi:S1-C subfamily serine protease
VRISIIILFVYSTQEVHPNSPAAQAGLNPHSDYILGSDAMSAEDDLFTFVESNNNKQVRLYVYNSDAESLREVSGPNCSDRCDC